MDDFNPTNCPHRAFIKAIAIVLFGLFTSAGTITAGWFIGQGFYQSRLADHFVSVKGIAEKHVKADLAIWDITYKAAGDDLQQTYAQINQNQDTIIAFLTKNSFTSADIEIKPTSVIDTFARDYGGDKAPHRYIVTGSIKIRSNKVDQVRITSQNANELIAANVVLSTKDFEANPRYLFTKLDEIRPEMLQQATKSARLVAQQFAADSNTKLGAIRRASQGLFQISNADSSAGQNVSTDNDQLADINKSVRVVSSIDFELLK